jgi:hypothetical protein
MNSDLIEATSTLALVDRDFEPDGAVLTAYSCPACRHAAPVRCAPPSPPRLRGSCALTRTGLLPARAGVLAQSTRVRTAAVHPSSGPLQWLQAAGRPGGRRPPLKRVRSTVRPSTTDLVRTTNQPDLT